MVQDLVHNLCEFLVENIDGVSGATSRKVVVATPVITLTGNSVTITCDTTGATIYYTLDGSTPTSSSSQYSSAFTLDSSCAIKAIAIKGGKSSGIAEEEYVKPITYLTQWKIVGNSQVHTDEYLTSWKVEGNSVVDNNAILSCGDYSDVDGKYHVKISNGVDVFDIALDEPLRKVNDVADTIEFEDGVATVTRIIGIWDDLSTMRWQDKTAKNDKHRYSSTDINNIVAIPSSTNIAANILTPVINTNIDNSYALEEGISVTQYGSLYIYMDIYADSNQVDALKQYLQGYTLIYELATPITELIDVSPFAVSPTDTYTSANAVPYSAFEHTENKEIWSCGEYNPTDGKYHILVQPLGGSIADIALDEPLRKVNDIADTIEFPSDTEGKALVTRLFDYVDLGTLSYSQRSVAGDSTIHRYSTTSLSNVIKSCQNSKVPNLLSVYPAIKANDTYSKTDGIGVDDTRLFIYDSENNQLTANEFKSAMNGIGLIYELATPTTELVDAPQIAEAESYTCVISQGAKAVEWSGFETE